MKTRWKMRITESQPTGISRTVVMQRLDWQQERHHHVSILCCDACV